MSFITEDFLLESEAARTLFHKYASTCPIIDYHNHLSPKLIAENHRFKSITELWLSGDHYKWRAMRANGIEESFITGDKSEREKFIAWASTVPYCLRNPLFHWTYLELKDSFDITSVTVSEKTAAELYEELNEKLQGPGYSTQEILSRFHVETVCTTDDPVDSLEYHLAHRRNSHARVHMLPAWRPDKAINFTDIAAWKQWVLKLEQASDTGITTFQNFLDALDRRHAFFHETGCRVSDHGLGGFPRAEFNESLMASIFDRALSGKTLEASEIEVFQAGMLHHFAVMDHGKGWVQQYHFGVIRNTNSRMFKELGPDSGFDTIGDFEVARPLLTFLDRLEQEHHLGKTILYNLNPRDNELLAALIGNFQDGFIPGKIQLGSAWWFLDQKQGIENHLNALSAMGLLSRFTGMLTDSRSFLSFSRHNYFRRILCNLIGSEIERGLLPDDLEFTGHIVRDISYFNAKRYFAFPLN